MVSFADDSEEAIGFILGDQREGHPAVVRGIAVVRHPRLPRLRLVRRGFLAPSHPFRRCGPMKFLPRGPEKYRNTELTRVVVCLQ